MTTIWYLILIIALVLVAGVMVYTKFAVRYREKQTTSDESAVNDTVEFTPAVISAPEVQEASTDEEDFVSEEADVSAGAEQDKDAGQGAKVESSLPALQVDPVTTEEDQENPAVDGYYDDLQEAAAGLAMLMRSSSSVPGESAPRFVVEPEGGEIESAEEAATVVADYSEAELPPVEMAEIPVDFVIQEVEQNTPCADDGECGIEENQPGSVDGTSGISEEWTSEEPPRSEVESFAPVEASVMEIAHEDVEEIDDSPEEIASEEVPDAEEPIARIDLGEEVTGRIEKIDSGLDALEELVASIEASLASFTPLTEPSDSSEAGDASRSNGISEEAA